MSERTTLRIPVDASRLEAIDDAHRTVRVVARDALGTLRTSDVTLDADGRGEAEIDVPNDLGDIQISIGPGHIPAEDLPHLRQPDTRISFEELREQPELRVPDFTIHPELWDRWRRWCRTFVVEGQVTCPNGKPVPGATVTAFDVDFWWWWTSWQKVGTATTDEDGRYRIEFRWCCGFAPWWWWWRRRHWSLDPVLADGLVGELQEVPELPRPTPRPDPHLFSSLVEVDDLVRLDPLFDPKPVPVALRAGAGDERLAARVQLEPPPQLSLKPLEDLRRQLVRKLPEPRIAQRLSLWPWYQWQPWFDCAPDLTFQVHAPCPEPGTLVLDETIFDVRSNVSTHETFDLVVQDEGCCLAPKDQTSGKCVVLSNVCSVDIEDIGGNETPPVATPAQAGYARFSAPPATPGFPPSSDAVDRPFAEVTHISGTFGTEANVDVYAFEFSPHGAGTWSPLPNGSVHGFSRRFYGPALGAPAGTTPDYHWAPFPVQTIDGVEVYSTRKHFEDTHELDTWGLGNQRLWLAANYFLLLNLQSKGYFADGTYDFRLVGWNLDAAGHLDPDTRRVLKLCGTQQANEVVITFDNRYVGGASGHPNVPDHPCGEGTVHVCTLEPDTDIIEIRVDGQVVKPCDILDLDGPMEIDFLAHDPDGHLALYSLHATYDENKTIDLLSLISGPQASLVSLDSPARPVGPRYRDALTQGATAPTWTGGRYRLTLPTPRGVFPKTCGYQLELKAWKRPIVSCSGHFAYRNQSHFTVTIKV